MSQKTKWEIDASHSEIGFKVKHMMFTNVSGKIEKYKAIIITDSDDFVNAIIDFTGDADSIKTGNAERDAHLISPDFFDAAQFPKINFVAGSFTRVDDTDFELPGDLTIHGITKPVTLAVKFGGVMKDPWGNTKAAFKITGKINRKDWGLNWNTALESGGWLVSEEVKIIAEIQLKRQ